MNTKGVEDGITDGPMCDCWKRERQVCDICQGVDSQTATLDELLRNVRSATPEELTAQRESYGKNYKPGPRQAVPFMPSAAVPVEERTSEIEQLMASLRAAAEHGMKSYFRDCYPLALATAPNILKLLDHIEGKAKAVSQEVKE